MQTSRPSRGVRPAGDTVLTAHRFAGLGWWRYRKGVGHIMMPLQREGRAQSRCRCLLIPRPKRDLPLVLPAGWTACKNCVWEAGA